MWQEEFAGRLRRDVKLAELTTARVGGPARLLVAPSSAGEAGRLLAALKAEGAPYRILGGGSNLLPPDGAVEEVVIQTAALGGFEIDRDRAEVGAGTPLATLVARCNGAALAGAHGLAGIPGLVGGALAMNAGGRYGEIADIVETVSLRLPDGEAVTFTAAELRFGYRHCELPQGALITGATFRLTPVPDRSSLKQISGRIIKEKNAVQPTARWTFGCMFKNPPGRSAGRLLDQAGLKGMQRGAARISPHHANFLENLGGATASEMRWLLERAESRVQEVFGVTLEREVRVWEEAALSH